jgi:hypothetical protein
MKFTIYSFFIIENFQRLKVITPTIITVAAANQRPPVGFAH